MAYDTQRDRRYVHTPHPINKIRPYSGTHTMSKLLTLSDDVMVYLIATHQCIRLRSVCHRLMRCSRIALGFLSPKHCLPSLCMPHRVFVTLKTEGDVAWFSSHYYNWIALHHIHIEAAFISDKMTADETLDHNLCDVARQPPMLQTMHLELGWVRLAVHSQAWPPFFAVCRQMVQQISLECLTIHAQGCLTTSTGQRFKTIVLSNAVG
jgi:hypothetical protein